MSEHEDKRMNMVQGICDHEVVVANSATVSGGFAFTGDSINAGIQAYFDMVNSQGGIDGRKIRFIHVDDKYDPKEAQTAFDYLVNQKKVFAYVGHFGSPIVSATLDLIRQKGIPVVYFATGIGELYVEHATEAEDGANCFPIQPLYITEGEEMVNTAVNRFGAKKIGVIYTPDDTGIDILVGAGRKASELKADFIRFNAGPDNSRLEEAVELLRKANADFVIVAAAQDCCVEIVKGLPWQQVKKPAILSYLNLSVTTSQEVVDLIRGKFDLFANAWLCYEGENAANLEVASAWLGDYAINAYAHCGWIGAHFFCEGLRRLEGQEVTWSSFTKAMERAPIKNPFGGEVDYANGRRKGFSSFYLAKADKTARTGWRIV